MKGRLGALGAMLLILLMAAVVRILNIDGPALWTDEGFTYYTFKIDLFDALMGDRHPPFYFYTLHAWEALAGDSILALRWWSMLPSMVTVAVMFQIGRELLQYLPDIPARSGWLGLPVLAALIMALADAENYMAQELRMYTWHVLFAACSLWAYLRFLRRPGRVEMLLWLAANLLLIYTHYFGGFVLLAQGFHALLFLRRGVRLKAFGVLAMTGLLFLPWILLVTVEQFSGEPVRVSSATIDIKAIWLDFRKKWFGDQWALMLVLLGAGFARIILQDRSALRWRDGTRGGLGLLLIGLVAIPIALSLVIGHDELVLLGRRLVQITVPLALLIAVGASLLSQPARAVVAVALILYGVTTVDWYRVKVPWDEVTALVSEYAQPDELALAEVGFEESALLYYYDHMLPDGMQISTFPVWSDMERFNYYEIMLPELLAKQPQMQSGVVTAWVSFFSPDEGILRKLEAAGFQHTMTRLYHHVGSVIDVYRYDLLPEGDVAGFENGMTLRAVEIVPDALRVDLWWEADEPLDADYTTSVKVFDAAGNLVAQKDSPVRDRPTSTWTADDAVYDGKFLELVGGETLSPGEYTVAAEVYRWTPDGIINVPAVGGEERFEIGRISR